MPKFPTTISVTSLDGTNGFTLNGQAELDDSGISVASAGDVNGDGIADFMIGARGVDSNGANAGAAYIVFGAAKDGAVQPFPATFELSSLNGGNGFKITGEATTDGMGGWQAGYSVDSAGDVNGDGVDDLIIGTVGNRASDQSSTTSPYYVVFGHKDKTDPFAATLDLTNLDGLNGFKITGAVKGGFWASSAGDVNGDGFDDVIVGASLASTSYVIFGHGGGSEESPFANVNLASLDGTSGFKIVGPSQNGATLQLNYNGVRGYEVAAAGDVNGDGVDDVIVGAPAGIQNNPAYGFAYVVFGRSQETDETSFPATFNLSDIDGTNGFAIRGGKDGDYLGFSVSAAGDVNGDKVADIIVGAPGADPHSSSGAGESYVVFGHVGGTDADPFPEELDVSTLDGIKGFAISGGATGDQSGYSVAAAGDVNGDGYDDLIIGANYATPNGASSGSSYVVFGHVGGTVKNPFPAKLDLSSLDGANGFRIDGVEKSQLGGSVSAAGDVNNDGFDDLIVGATSAAPHGMRSGSSYVIYGHAIFDGPTIALATAEVDEFAKNGTFIGALSVEAAPQFSGTVTYKLLDDDDERFTISGNGLKVADGLKFDYEQASKINLTVRATDAHGHTLTQQLKIDVRDINPELVIGLSRSDTFVGGDMNDDLRGMGGADTLSGGKGTDILRGGDGDDVLQGGAGGDFFEGGAGNDTASYTNAEPTFTPDPPKDPKDDPEQPEGLFVSLVSLNHANNNGEAKDDSFSSIENLIGSNYKDRLIGDTNDNVLQGGNGADTLEGSNGNDVLVGGDGGDKLYGTGSNSNDVDTASYEGAIKAVTASLNQPKDNKGDAKGDQYFSIDNLVGSGHYDTLEGNGKKNGLWGAAGKDQLEGRGGADKLYGGTGKDKLSGGDGKDIFVFDTALSKKLNVDKVTDFSVAKDTIWLDNDIFHGIGKVPASDKDGHVQLDASRFWASGPGKAHDKGDRIVYDKSDGHLYYDADGKGKDGPVLFAELDGHLDLSAKDFMIIA